MAEEEHKDPSDKPSINEKNWAKTLEEVEEYFRNHLGHQKTPLSYITRRDVDVPPHIGDPQANYTVVQDEMVRRAPHIDTNGNPTDHYHIDNQRVWTLISELTRDHKCWTYVKPFQRARDGRAAFLALRAHYLGTNMVNNMASGAETKLQNATYSKEGKRWNFESYVSTHKEQHQILQQLEEDHNYKGLDEGTKVRFLLAGIKTDKLDTIKAQILGDPTLQTDFDRCVNLFKAFLEQVSNDQTQTFNVSRVGTTNDGKDRAKGSFKNKKWVRKGGKPQENKGGKRKFKEGGNEDVEDRYYKPKEYSALTPAQRAKLQKFRDERQRTTAATVTELDRKVAALQLNAVKQEEDEDDDESSPQNNRNNAALQ